MIIGRTGTRVYFTILPRRLDDGRWAVLEWIRREQDDLGFRYYKASLKDLAQVARRKAGMRP